MYIDVEPIIVDRKSAEFSTILELRELEFLYSINYANNLSKIYSTDFTEEDFKEFGYEEDFSEFSKEEFSSRQKNVNDLKGILNKGTEKTIVSCETFDDIIKFGKTKIVEFPLSKFKINKLSEQLKKSQADLDLGELVLVKNISTKKPWKKYDVESIQRGNIFVRKDKKDNFDYVIKRREHGKIVFSKVGDDKNVYLDYKTFFKFLKKKK